MPQTLIEPINLHKKNFSEGVGFFKDDSLTTQQKNLLKKLNGFDAPYLQEKLIEKGEFSSVEEYQEAFIEFKRYVFLTQIFGNNLAMMSTKVDAIWHQFILFTKAYHDFCEDNLQYFLHHTPYINGTPKSKRIEGFMNFKKYYKMIFGEIPKIWDLDKKDLNENSVCNCDGCDPS
ncbi:hypothetical protein J4407_01295 [Candidatus Pacearchaeota archaeon]|nr:hypothetical protein [Candidatus Pacearchaeota archaeon]